MGSIFRRKYVNGFVVGGYMMGMCVVVVKLFVVIGGVWVLSVFLVIMM